MFFIVIICFGVAFQEEFSSTRYGPYGNEHANFRSLFNTILTLFRITTGENWVFVLMYIHKCLANHRRLGFFNA